LSLLLRTEKPVYHPPEYSEEKYAQPLQTLCPHQSQPEMEGTRTIPALPSCCLNTPSPHGNPRSFLRVPGNAWPLYKSPGCGIPLSPRIPSLTLSQDPIRMPGTAQSYFPGLSRHPPSEQNPY